MATRTTHSLPPASRLRIFPQEIDCPSCGFPAGRDKENPPLVAKIEPYKTHLAYVKERRTDAEAKQILDEALQLIRERREKAAAAAKARR